MAFFNFFLKTQLLNLISLCSRVKGDPLRAPGGTRRLLRVLCLRIHAASLSLWHSEPQWPGAYEGAAPVSSLQKRQQRSGGTRSDTGTLVEKERKNGSHLKRKR